MKFLFRKYRTSIIISLSVLVFLFGAYFIQKAINSNDGFKDEKPVGKVDENDDEDSIPVNTETTESLQFPFAGDVKMVRFFYNASDSEEKRALSMTSFEGVFRPNQGVDFSNDGQQFDVLAVFTGTVTQKREDSIFGWTITIESSDGIKATYQSVKDVLVEKGTAVSAGEKIAVSGENIYNKDLGNHLHFVLEKNGVIINPESNFNVKLTEIK